MRPAMYIFLNKGLKMSTGKAAAQASHAAVEAYRASCGMSPHAAEPPRPNRAGETDLVREWYTGGHYMKLVMEARDSIHLQSIQAYLEARGFKTALIIDEGHTEVESHTPTALGVGVVDKDNPHVEATFGDFKLYRDSSPVTLLESTEKIDPGTLAYVRGLVGENRLDEAKRVLRDNERSQRRKHRFGLRGH